MEKERIDKTFREKLGKITGLPSEVNWSSERGWKKYEEQYLPKRSTGKRIILYVGSVAAAILLVFFSIRFFQHNRYRTILVSNDKDEILEMVLPDSNRIWLNRNSSVEYPSIINENHCEVSVNGEAYFEIRRLQTPKYKIKAHNAVILIENASAFNIRARMQEENVHITVASGALKIMEESYQEGLALLVTEGSYCSVHKSQNLVYTSANRNENYLAWKTGKLRFNSMPIATVTDILNEYYHTQIELEDKTLAYCLFSGTFEDQSIDIVLNQIQTDLDFVIRNTGNKITISGKGCL